MEEQGAGAEGRAAAAGTPAAAEGLALLRRLGGEAARLERAAADLDQGGGPDELTEARSHLEALLAAVVRAKAHLDGLPKRPRPAPRRR